MKIWAIALLLIGVPRVAGAAATDCLSCHPAQAAFGDSAQAAVKDTAHAALSCTACHSTIQSFPHPAKQTPVDCSSCHAADTTALAQSAHAAAGGPSCQSCHGNAHSILPVKDPRSPVFASNLPRTCGACHGNTQDARRLGLPGTYTLYMDSIHGFALTQEGLLVAANCSSCHGTHAILSGKDPKSMTSHANIPQTCGTCHAGPLREFSAGIHGQILRSSPPDAPVCTTCHSAHQTVSVSGTEFQLKTTATCGGCHQDEFATWRDTFHAQVSALGYRQTARCWDCHGYHDILPDSDPKSMVASANLIHTCGKCHPGANASFVKYDPHADAHDAVHYPGLHYAAVFMNLLLASVLGFFALHTLLWFLRARSGGEESDAAKTPPRTESPHG